MSSFAIASGRRFGASRDIPDRSTGQRPLPEQIALGPLSFGLTQALRRAARRKPQAFARLGAFREASFVIAPSGLPIAFVLRPNGVQGAVQVVVEPRAWDAKISGPLSVLLGLFDGGLDADAAFFARQIQFEGDTEALMALRNALESAELGLVDLLPAPPLLRKRLDAGLSWTARAARKALGTN